MRVLFTRGKNQNELLTLDEACHGLLSWARSEKKVVLDEKAQTGWVVFHSTYGDLDFVFWWLGVGDPKWDAVPSWDLNAIEPFYTSDFSEKEMRDMQQHFPKAASWKVHES